MPDLISIEGLEALSAPSERDDLVRARLAIHASVPLQKLFDLASTEAWDTKRLAAALEWELMGLGIDVAPSVCRFLADEFSARDKATTLLVSAETGLALAQVPQDAIYVPAPVAREGSDKLATPLPRLKPEYEAAIIRYRNAVAEEPLVTAKLQERARSTELQRADGDERLRIATRGGRKRLGERLREELPGLLADHRGSMGRLFARCRVNERVPHWCETHVSLTLHGYGSMLVADSLAMNFRHDAFGGAREMIRAGWGRLLAQAITGVAHKAGRPREVSVTDPLPPGLLIGPPDLAVSARHLEVLPVADALATMATGSFFLKVMDDAYEFDSYEESSRWCVDATVRVDLYLDVQTLQPLVFNDLVETEIVAEVVS